MAVTSYFQRPKNQGYWCKAWSESEGLRTRNSSAQGRRRWVSQLKQKGQVCPSATLHEQLPLKHCYSIVKF